VTRSLDPKSDSGKTQKSSELPKTRGSTLKPVPASIKMNLFGDLLKFSKSSPDTLSFRKFDHLAVTLAQKPREERILIYKIFCGLSLTAHARRTPDASERKKIFDLKNKLFISIANDPVARKMTNLRVGVSKRFKVIEYCADCKQKNAAAQTPQREWKFCQKCKIDRNYYNIISLYHRFEEGAGSLFLGQDLLEQIYSFKIIKKAPLHQMSEELSFSKYKYSPKTLISVELNSLKSCSEKLLVLQSKLNSPVPADKTDGPKPLRRN
jgi:hypothetical protein